MTNQPSIPDKIYFKIGEVARLTGQAEVRDDVTETAAWVALARALLNLDEFVSRE